MPDHDPLPFQDPLDSASIWLPVSESRPFVASNCCVRIQKKRLKAADGVVSSTSAMLSGGMLKAATPVRVLNQYFFPWDLDSAIT